MTSNNKKLASVLMCRKVIIFVKDYVSTKIFSLNFTIVIMIKLFIKKMGGLEKRGKHLLVLIP